MNLIRSLALKVLWVLFPLALLAAPPARATPSHGPAGPVAGTMEVAVSGGEIRVSLTFSNHSQRIVWLEKLEAGQMPLRSEFEIRTEDGRMVPYLGPTAKRPPFAKGDFFPLEPGHASRREIRIQDRYDFPEGEAVYKLTFSYLSWNDKTREAVFRSLKSVRFTYSR
ncbi:MAG: hypothetical protein P4L36_07900 [Holophaga sp.]|nr:hypothetical protein [Holophaga sp.]